MRSDNTVPCVTSRQQPPWQYNAQVQIDMQHQFHVYAPIRMIAQSHSQPPHMQYRIKSAAAQACRTRYACSRTSERAELQRAGNKQGRQCADRGIDRCKQGRERKCIQHAAQRRQEACKLAAASTGNGDWRCGPARDHQNQCSLHTMDKAPWGTGHGHQYRSLVRIMTARVA